MPPPQDPPDGGGSLEVRNQGVSFKDKLVGTSTSFAPRRRVDLIKEKLARFDYVDGIVYTPFSC